MELQAKKFLCALFGALCQGLSIDVPYPFLEGAFLVTGTVLLIKAFENE